MRNRKKLTVKMNGETIDKQEKLNQKQAHFNQKIYNEQAATNEITNKNVNPFARDKGNKKKGVKISNMRRIGYVKELKPIIIAVITAIFIGSVLGFILLKMFVNIDNGLANTSNSNPVVHLDANTKDTPKENTSKVTLPSIQAFVLQGGVFSAEENAKEFASKYNKKNINTVIWERDNQYYLITGLANSKESANDLADQQEGHGLEVFVKEWESPAIEVQLANNEFEWFQSLHNLLVKSIDGINGKDSLPVDGWSALFDENKTESEKIISFKEKIEPYTKNIKEGGKSDIQYELLEIWYELEAFLSKL
ncbi:MAG TPA: SPOR domain-containing protein [Candidatus Avamphibacillus sp.]|nr:SPOR domain-containing protein [Candidatus Avamphibacillus sp.]